MYMPPTSLACPPFIFFFSNMMDLPQVALSEVKYKGEMLPKVCAPLVNDRNLSWLDPKFGQYYGLNLKRLCPICSFN